MFNVGVGEMMMLILVALLVFGPKRLPEIARNMGRFMRNFQQETNRALSDLKQGIEPATTGIFDEPDFVPSTAPEQAELPAAAFGAAPPAATTRRKTSTRTSQSKRPAAPARKRAVAAKRPSPAKQKAAATKKRVPAKTSAKKGSRRR